MHHLRSGADREWAEFPARAEGTELVLAFHAKPNEAEHTLRLRHRDLKQLWRVSLNGTEIARLPLDEADAITYWPVPPGTLREGSNELRVHCAGNASDDVSIGQVMLIDRPVAQVLSEATVNVSVIEEPSGRGVPSRITVVDKNGTLTAIGITSGPQQAVRPGVVYNGTGSVRLKLPAGRYVIHAGRGFEYSVATTEVDVTQGSNVSRRLAIRREVDTSGWAAMDTHVHTGTFAKHGDAGIDERMLTIAGEGIELPVSTEHNMLVDLDRDARAAGVRAHFTPVVGSEVTTPSIGHFNVFPIPGNGKAIDQRAPGWTALREAIGSVTTQAAIVLNHGRDLHGGFRPLGPARHIGVAGEDLEGWPLPANAMEIVNSGAVMTDGLALPRDWMGMLNRGAALTPVGSSDSHDVSRYIVGQARTYVRCDDRDPGSLDVTQAVESVRHGRTMVAYGLLAEIDVGGKGPGRASRSDSRQRAQLDRGAARGAVRQWDSRPRSGDRKRGARGSEVGGTLAAAETTSRCVPGGDRERARRRRAVLADSQAVSADVDRFHAVCPRGERSGVYRCGRERSVRECFRVCPRVGRERDGRA
jgi:hypothetical protein